MKSFIALLTYLYYSHLNNLKYIEIFLEVDKGHIE